ncbi:mechanosensitive ion channel family protein [Halodesulfurarchaeum sp.]|uniref:mechanosensitive ion channel family protein n=1 Tax=Halodesulfurarchaeum sp. TaxID=1980530 RepID=UPI002FC39BBF
MALGLDPEWIEIFYGGGSVETKLGLTIGVILLGILFISSVVPRLVRAGLWAFQKVLGWFGLESAYEMVSPAGHRLGIGFALIRILQLLVIGGASILVIGIWGEIGLLFTLLGEVSIPVSILGKALITLFLLVGAYSGMELLHRWVGELTNRSDRISQHQEEIWVRVLQIIFLTAAIIVLLALWGIDLGGLLVGAGFLGIVAGLAAQQTLGSLIAGFVLMLSRPFEIGDWVEIGDNEGIVTEITIVNTRLENYDGELIALPNDLVGNSKIVNRTKKGRLRLRVEVGIDYDADPEHASEVASAALQEVDRVLTVPRPRVVTSRFGDSAIVLELRFWMDKPSARRRALAISEAIKTVSKAFQEEGIKIPFPQHELSSRAETGGFQVVDESTKDD